ncbi:secondary carrier transporter [Lithospermum erythrorhizon]|uniref:Secondary carrier transporter n=1 Tax=Lithospermum erythrorhizon TaxID=34254 RepID=A0AAV3RM31_LITER
MNPIETKLPEIEMEDTTEKMKHSLQVEPAQSMATAQNHESPLGKIFMVASIATGIQFIWALQLSLLTPYVQLLGIPHKLASLIWLCGPIAGIVVQPIAGYYSDNSASRFGRRRPYLTTGTAFIVVAVFLISFAADIGHAIGDPLGNSIKPRAIIVFVIGFCLLHIANNILQGPCRAFLGDLSGTNTSKTRTSNASFAFFLSLGGILGYATGSFNNLHKMFPFTVTNACDVYCANLKCCFFLSITILMIVTTLVLSFVKEELNPKEAEQTNTISNEESRTKNVPFFIGMLSAMKDLPKSMWILLLVTFMNIFASFSYRMFGTDWMGREVYGGKVGEGDLYYQGVHVGSLGLMIQAIMLGVTSLGIELLARGLGGGVNKLWGFSNFLLAICLCLLVLITKLAESSRRYTTAMDGKITPMPPDVRIKAGALALFGLMGIPQAVSYFFPTN